MGQALWASECQKNMVDEMNRFEQLCIDGNALAVEGCLQAQAQALDGENRLIDADFLSGCLETAMVRGHHRLVHVLLVHGVEPRQQKQTSDDSPLTKAATRELDPTFVASTE